jgi:hypothetical protein
VRKRKLLLCIAPISLCLLDQTVTLIGQSSQYWGGDYAVGKEGNPLYLRLLQQHPLAFEAGILAWILLFCAVICFAPRRAALAISVAIVLGHAWGASSWICYRLVHGYWIVIGLYLVSGIIIAWTWDRFHRMAIPDSPDNKSLHGT